MYGFQCTNVNCDPMSWRRLFIDHLTSHNFFPSFSPANWKTLINENRHIKNTGPLYINQELFHSISSQIFSFFKKNN